MFVLAIAILENSAKLPKMFDMPMFYYILGLIIVSPIGKVRKTETSIKIICEP
jgi:hypothetical protein